MKKLTVLLITVLFIGCSQKPVEGLIDWNADDHTRAEQVVNALVLGEYASVREDFDSAMKNALSLKKLRKAWEETLDEAGAYIEWLDTEILPHDEYDIYLVTTLHENKKVVTRVVFNMGSAIRSAAENEEGEIPDVHYPYVTGLHFRVHE